MQVLSKPVFRASASLAAAGALVLVLTASKCGEETTFPAFVAEICSDNIDNNSDGKIDCADPSCGGTAACTVSLSFDVLPGVITKDTLVLTGHQTNATSVAVLSVTPAGNSSPATITGETWSATLTNLTQRTTYTVTVVGSKGELRDTVHTTFIRGD
jgi:hypothetical protein